MATIKELKESIDFNVNLIDLLETMKSTAVFQFRALQAKKERYEKFFDAIKGFFELIGERGAGHALVTPRTGREAIIMVTSDEGFMGSLNAQVINAASLQEKFETAELIMIGERGARYLKELGRPFVPFGGAVDAASRRTLAAALGAYLISGVKEGRFGKVSIAYPKPVSFVVQRVEITKMIPFFDAPPAEEKKPEGFQELIVESDLGGIIDYLSGELVRQRIVDVLEESKLSEFAARAMHLEGSSQQLAEKTKKIKLQYFKAYHESIDKSTRELYSAQMLIRK
ncbi:MAG: F0F1 ATP synthase subunit gamma [Candidatus Omnitrophica bacterium]|nr:F0F1 ATP synthase subunit gamma [Candidatus Omnitrophota bacterium]MDD5436849.1 F0F1 ATP synthase subunit gamma [Candidatus Omnitrophota bacterium]